MSTSSQIAGIATSLTVLATQVQDSEVLNRKKSIKNKLNFDADWYANYPPTKDLTLNLECFLEDIQGTAELSALKNAFTSAGKTLTIIMPNGTL